MCVRCNYVFLSFHFLVSNLLLLVYMVQPALTDKYIKSRRILQSQVKPLIWLWICMQLPWGYYISVKDFKRGLKLSLVLDSTEQSFSVPTANFQYTNVRK